MLEKKNTCTMGDEIENLSTTRSKFVDEKGKMEKPMLKATLLIQSSHH